MEYNNLNTELNTFVINYITRLYLFRDFDSLITLGLSRKTAERIANMSQIDTLRLSGFPSRIANFQVTERHLDLMIQHVQQEGKKDLLIDQMIELDASQVMLKVLTGMESAEYRERRQALGLPKASPGRPAILDGSESNSVHNTWHMHQGHEELYRYYLVAMDTNISLSRIWHHMQSQH